MGTSSYAPERVPNSIRKIEAELGRRSFRHFIKFAWPTAEPAMEYVDNWHIHAVADHLQAVTEGQIKRLVINEPPGHAKSLVVSVMWPAWCWIRRELKAPDRMIQGPKWRALFASYGEDLSLRDSQRCRDLITSPWFQDTFCPEWKLTGDQNLKSFFQNTEKGFRIALSVGGKGTGFRGDAFVVDDPLNAKDQYSDTKLEYCIFWWDKVASSRLNNMATGARIIVMQRLSERDLSGHVIKQGGYEHLCLPSEFEPERRIVTSIGFTDPRKDFGELLFPSLFPRTVIDQAKTDLGSSGFAGQHQQRPAPAGGGILKRHWWGYWKPAGVELPPVRVKLPDGSWKDAKLVDLPASFDTELQSWDCTFKDNDGSDFVAGLALGRKSASRFVLDALHGRWDLPGTIVQVRELTKRRPRATLKLVEDKANGPAVIQSLRHEISGLVEVNPEGGKISRAAAISPEVEAGNWYLPHPAIAPWVEEFLVEAETFPAGRHDDYVDAWSQGGLRLQRLAGGLWAYMENQQQQQQQPPIDNQDGERH